MDAMVKLSAATSALSEARTLEDVRQIMNLAEAARTYARAAKLGLESLNHAAEIKLRAERKAGELLAQLERKPGARTDKLPDSLSAGSEYRQVLDENDLGERQAERWQTIASLPDEVFEEEIAWVKSAQEEITTAHLLTVAEELKEATIAANHEWSESELKRREDVEAGWTRIANMRTDLALIAWAIEQDLFERIDRMTAWGNPFVFPADGDRMVVIENYQWYLDNKPSLLAKLDTLKGKVLGCWCHPEHCHGDVLQEYADDTAD